jgi:hypothetical protein
LPAAAATPTRRHILPNNLPAAVKQLDDIELDRLLSAILAEQERRGKNRATSGHGSTRRKVEADTNSLSVGKANAVRAAFKAGVKPSRIAREFGLSQADVHQALAEKATR